MGKTPTSSPPNEEHSSKGSKKGSPKSPKGSQKDLTKESPNTSISKNEVDKRYVDAATVVNEQQLDEDDCCTPDFIYGGPFIPKATRPPFMDSATPINMQLQGTFKKSFAFYSLKERLPIILTKIIDYITRESVKIKLKHGADDEDLISYIRYVTKLKNDLVTNKKYSLFIEETADAKKWNSFLEAQEANTYFTNTWVFSECYVYRRLREGCEISKNLKDFDPFDEQKEKSLQANIELMCVVADRLANMLPVSEKDKRKADFITLLKLCLWSNKCDLSLSVGEMVALKDSKTDLPKDPFQMILDLKDKLLVDDTSKIADQIVAKADAMAKAVTGNTTFKFQCSCHRLATLAGMPVIKKEEPVEPEKTDKEVEASQKEEPKEVEESQKAEEPPKIPCPAKMVIPQAVMFDIICDNSGYELFTDLCLAHFLVAQNIVQKVRFHVKNMPWFVSDVTERDFIYLIDTCVAATYSREIKTEPKPAPPGGEAPPPGEPMVVSATNLRAVATVWRDYVNNGVFVLLAEPYWTWPHCYKDMKRLDYHLYRSLQYAVGLMFKGDLNYRKLVGEKNWNPTTGFEPALQGFMPAPIIAARTVKSDLICGLPKGKWEAITKVDDKWMEKGDYGVVQYCPKGEPLKAADRPCADYGAGCGGGTCPAHHDI